MAPFGRPSEKDTLREQRFREWTQRQNPFAIASVVLGVISMLEFGALLVFGIGGIVTGAIALKQLKTPEGARIEGKRLAWIGITLSIVSLVCASILYSLKPKV